MTGTTQSQPGNTGGKGSRGKVQVETKDVNLPETQTVNLSPDEKPDLTIIKNETVDDPLVKEFLSDLRFNEDIIEFSIGMDSNPNAENPVPACCNGEVHLIQRGKRYRLARKFVDSLIKTTFRVETEEYEDKNGLKQTRVNRIPSAAYPISIHNDPAGETGVRWFEHMNANAY